MTLLMPLMPSMRPLEMPSRWPSLTMCGRANARMWPNVTSARTGRGLAGLAGPGADTDGAADLGSCSVAQLKAGTLGGEAESSVPSVCSRRRVSDSE